MWQTHATARVSFDTRATRWMRAGAERPQVDARTLEYFSIELITAVVASTSTAVARQEERRRRFELDNAAPSSSSAPVASTSKPASVDGADPNDPPENELRQRIDLIGFRVGWGLAERCVAR